MIEKIKKNSNKEMSENFNSNEFDCKCGKYCNETLIDTKLVEYLQQIRNHFNAPITITSGYRCATHNKNVGGATASYHSRGQATDIVVKGVKPAEVAKYAESIGILGIGLYDSFTHIDTRTTKSFWYSADELPRDTFGGSNLPTTPGSATTNQLTITLPTLKRGDSNISVRVLQALLKIASDGIYGNATNREVKAFQKKNGLTEDGVVGADTWNALFKQCQ